MRGLVGWVRWEGCPAALEIDRAAGGVYVVLREDPGEPAYLEASPAGTFRGDPSASRDALVEQLGGRGGRSLTSARAITGGQSALEVVANRDTWGKGTDSYLHMMYERLVLMRDLLNERGSICLHCDWHASHLLKLVLVDVFGRRNFRNEIV
jgi:hypothetical protein